MLVTRGHEAISRGVARHTGGREPKVRRESPTLASPSASFIVSLLVLQFNYRVRWWQINKTQEQLYAGYRKDVDGTTALRNTMSKQPSEAYRN